MAGILLNIRKQDMVRSLPPAPQDKTNWLIFENNFNLPLNSFNVKGDQFK